MRLGLLATVSYAYEAMPADLAERKLEETRAAAATLEASLGDEVLVAGLVSSVEEGSAAGHKLADAGVYGVVVLPTIATMAAYPWAALEAVEAPVVVWSRTEPRPEPAGTADLVYGSTPVGALAIGNVLMREQRTFCACSGQELSERAISFLRGARLASQLRTATFAHFGGDVWPGMLDVVLDRDALERALGARVVDLEPVLEGPPAEVDDRLVLVDVEPEALRRSLSLAGAVERACTRAGIVGGSFNCHGAAFAQNPEIGVVCCAAVNHLTSRGVPFACTGDDCTAVALFLAVTLAGASQLLELDAIDESLDACLVTSGGEGDIRLARPGVDARLVGNRFFLGLAGRGAALDFALRPGPVTLVGFTPSPGSFRVIAAEAEVIDALPPDLGVPRGYVRFAGPARDFSDHWCEAGANHHLALAPGRHARSLAAFAEIAGIEAVVL